MATYKAVINKGGVLAMPASGDVFQVDGTLATNTIDAITATSLSIGTTTATTIFMSKTGATVYLYGYQYITQGLTFPNQAKISMGDDGGSEIWHDISTVTGHLGSSQGYNWMCDAIFQTGYVESLGSTYDLNLGSQSAYTRDVYIGRTGRTVRLDGALNVISGSTTITTGIIRAVGSQTADLLKFQSSTPSDLLTVSAAGNVTFTSTTSQALAWPNFSIGQTATTALTIKVGSTAVAAFDDSGNLDFQGAGHYITNVLDPVNAQDAATRSFVYAARPVNYVLNGSFNIWQRNTTFPSANTKVFTADHWYIQLSDAATKTISRQSPAGTGVVPNTTYCVRIQRNSGQTSTTNTNLFNEIDREVVKQLRGQTVALYVKCRGGANVAATASVGVFKGTAANGQSFAAGYTGNTSLVSATLATPGTAWVQMACSAPFTVPTDSTQLGVLCGYVSPSGTAGANDYIDYAEVMLCPAAANLTTAPPFVYYGGSWSQEYWECMRYFEKSYGYEWPVGNLFGVLNPGGFQITGDPVDSYAVGSGSFWPGTQTVFKVPKRTNLPSVSPTMTFYALDGTVGNLSIQATNRATGGGGVYYDGFAATNNTGGSITITGGVNAKIVGQWTAESEI